jgi:ABC-type Fe3+-hydroxamate transport system substrate-binding protein
MHRPSRPGVRVGIAGAVLPLLALAGCSSSSGSAPATTSPGTSASASSAASASATFPVTVKADNGDVTVPAAPKAIVSLAPSTTEMLYAIGAGGQVTAVDDQSTYPSQAPRTSLSGFKPNAEAIAARKPDLVVLSTDTGGIVRSLSALKVPVLLLDAPKSLDAAYAQEELLGRATGHPAEAQKAVEGTKARIAKAVASVTDSGKALKVYHELDPTYFSVTSDTFIGDVYKQFHLQNVADASPKAAGGYPQLSAEYVVSAAPDLIVLADSKCCQQSPGTVAKRPAFASVPAVMSGRVVAVDDDIASRWGPRVADFAEQIAKTLASGA